jgi:predicted nucleic acid-binding protein
MIGVVDASALIRCFIPDGPVAPGLDQALRQAESGDMVLFAPQLLLVEAGSVILNTQRRGVMSATEGQEILGLVAQMPIRYIEHESMLEAALSLAVEWSLSFYDAHEANPAKPQDRRHRSRRRSLPGRGRGQLLIGTTRTLVSAGTERMLVDFGKAGFIDKARQQPDKVRMVLDKIAPTACCRRWMPCATSSTSRCHGLLQRGRGGGGRRRRHGVCGRRPGGSRTASMPRRWRAGEPVRQGARIRERRRGRVHRAGAIALQGIRLVQPTLGEAVVVTGLGLIGLVTVQLLRPRAAACWAWTSMPTSWRWRGPWAPRWWI